MDNEMKVATENVIETRGLKQKSLLAKYDIPIDHLSYEYIRGSDDVKKLERIVKILRSGEEGIFPDLQKTAEERLRKLSPNNRHLRIDVPALNRSCFTRREWGNIWDDIENWKKEVSNREKQLRKVNCIGTATNLPPVRQTLLTKQSSENKKNKPKSKVKISDYAFWDKYDVDTELLKMDVEEEQKYVSEAKKTCITQTGQDRIEQIKTESLKLSETEKLMFAEKEKTRGNEFYRAKDYTEAEKCYTASLAIYPTANAYNNRAECFIKQCRYTAAIQDAENVLKLDPNNVKALFRKGIALKHENEFEKALECMNQILKQDPNHSQAQHVAKQLKENTNIKTSDYSIRDFKPTERQFLPDSSHCFEVNEWGLPKTLCQCEGAIKFYESQPALPPLRGHATEKKPGNIRITELSETYEQPKQNKSTKLEIIEIEKPPHEPLEDFYTPMKCNIVDKRTDKKGFRYGGGDVM